MFPTAEFRNKERAEYIEKQKHRQELKRQQEERTSVAIKAAEFIYQCMDDMQDTWTDTISEILSFLIYGWSAHELVYKRRAGKS
ncbi:MAG: hypothetical protein U9N81_13440 [Bacillota bacterium]|nr:hypothetical protein [Bacillota bacterium]